MLCMEKNYFLLEIHIFTSTDAMFGISIIVICLFNLKEETNHQRE